MSEPYFDAGIRIQEYWLAQFFSTNYACGHSYYHQLINFNLTRHNRGFKLVVYSQTWYNDHVQNMTIGSRWPLLVDPAFKKLGPQEVRNVSKTTTYIMWPRPPSIWNNSDQNVTKTLPGHFCAACFATSANRLFLPYQKMLLQITVLRRLIIQYDHCI